MSCSTSLVSNIYHCHKVHVLPIFLELNVKKLCVQREIISLIQNFEMRQFGRHVLPSCGGFMKQHNRQFDNIDNMYINVKILKICLNSAFSAL